VEGSSGAAAAADPAVAPDEAEAEADIDQAAQEMSDLSDLVEENPGVEARADEVFTPDEEISEDYPVPLPSDI
jgi:hypothetical protein